jgi:uncharacterized protein
MLKLHLPAVARDEVRLEEQIPVDHPAWAGVALPLSGPVALDLRARSVGDGVLVRGTVRTRIEVPCRRCLRSVTQAMEETLDLLFVPAGDNEDEDFGGEVYPLPLRGLDLDLADPIREQLILRVPEYALCSEECRGLCSQCGTDLNQATCDCVPEAGQSPWDALKKLEQKH